MKFTAMIHLAVMIPENSHLNLAPGRSTGAHFQAIVFKPWILAYTVEPTSIGTPRLLHISDDFLVY